LSALPVRRDGHGHAHSDGGSDICDRHAYADCAADGHPEPNTDAGVYTVSDSNRRAISYAGRDAG
jgi:hypothetical protein